MCSIPTPCLPHLRESTPPIIWSIPWARVGSFEDQDRVAARNFAAAARESGVRRIVYLGGLGDDDDQLSMHLRSRHEVGEILKESGSVVVEFRASIRDRIGQSVVRTGASTRSTTARDDLPPNG